MIRALKPSLLTSAGFILVAASNIFTAPPLLLKIGWALVGIGTVWFFLKTR